MCLSPQTGVIAGGGHWGVLTTTAYWTLGVSLWLWRPSMKDKWRLSSTEQIFLFNEKKLFFGNGGPKVLIFKVSFHPNFSTNYHFSSPGSPQTRASAGNPTTLPSSPSSLQAWHPSRGPRPWVSVCGASGLRKTVSPCGWPSPLISRASLQENVSQDATTPSTAIIYSAPYGACYLVVTWCLQWGGVLHQFFHYRNLPTHDLGHSVT